MWKTHCSYHGKFCHFIETLVPSASEQWPDVLHKLIYGEGGNVIQMQTTFWSLWRITDKMLQEEGIANAAN